MRRSRLLSLLVALGLLVSACGDDDSSTDSSAEGDTTDASSELVETTDDEPTDVAEDALAEGLGECGFLAEFATAFDDFDPTAAFSGAEAVDFGQMFAPIAEAAQDVAADAPSEIEDAFETVAERFSTVAEELDGVVIDMSDPENIDPEAMAAFEDLDASFGEEFDAAGEEIDAWMSENCADFAEALDLESFGG